MSVVLAGEAFRFDVGTICAPADQIRSSILPAHYNPTLGRSAIVATAIAGHNRPAELESVVLEFLNGDTVIRWAELTLGL